MTTSKGRVLCTEDDQDTRDLIVFVLREYGFDVICASDANKALELAKTQLFDLYLIDHWMPGLSGTGLTHELRKFDSTTPILFYSGAAYDRDKKAALASGAQGYLVKPADGDTLLAEIVRLIEESTAGKA
ncbi:MAG TPA: response regulator [Pyrinomonadaceae bacterium]|nr:response regulator [Pyrinomonadaceae bacterium]